MFRFRHGFTETPGQQFPGDSNGIQTGQRGQVTFSTSGRQEIGGFPVKLTRNASVLIREQEARYLLSLPRKKSDLQTAWDRAHKQSWSGKSTEQFKTLVHRLAGSAGSYGLDELGRAAKCLDHLLGSMPPEEAPGKRAAALFREVILQLDLVTAKNTN